MEKHTEWLAAYLADGNDSLSHLFFDESKHKRDKSGRFAKKDGGNGSSKTTTVDSLLKNKKLTEMTPSERRLNNLYEERATYADALERAKKKYQDAEKYRQKLWSKKTEQYDPDNPHMTEAYRTSSDEYHKQDALVNALYKEMEQYQKIIESYDKDRIPTQRLVVIEQNKNAEKFSSKKSVKEKLSDIYDSAMKGSSEKVNKIKNSLGSLIDKVSSSAKSGKDNAQALVSKGKKYLDNAFTSTVTEFHTQAEKLKQKKKSLLTKTKYDTSSYKNT